MTTANKVKLWLTGDGAPALHVHRFAVRESMSGLWRVDAVVTSDDDRFAFDDYIDRGAAFCLERPESHATPARLWTGICSEIAHLSAQNSGHSSYAITIVPELWRLSLRTNSRVFQHMTIPEIVLQILGEWEIKPPTNLIVRFIDGAGGDDAARKFPKLEMRVQYEESDLAFVSRLLEEAGISYYFEYATNVPGPKGETKGRELTKLVLDAEPHLATDDAKAAAGRGLKLLVGPLPYRGRSERVDLGDGDDFAFQASATRAIRPGTVALMDHDFRQPLGQRPRQVVNLKDEAGERHYEQYAYAPGSLHAELDRSEGDEPEIDEPRALDVMLGHRNFSCVTEFLTNALHVAPGTVLGLDAKLEQRGEIFKTAQLVVATEIHGDTDGRWPVRCTTVAATLPYRPPRITPKPRIMGVQSALVVGQKNSPVDDEQIVVDRFGRVRIEFHWDRVHQYGVALEGGAKGGDGDLLGSCWVRVATPWAGGASAAGAANPGYGFVAIPRVGHEVLVAFLDGDPDRPVIVRSLHHGKNPAPFGELDVSREAQAGVRGGPRGATVSGLRTCSSPNGAGYNELSFDDKAGGQRLHMQAQNVLSTIVKAAETHDVGVSRHTAVGAADTVNIADEWRLVAGDNQNGIWVSKDNRIRAQVGGANGSQVELSQNGIYLNAKKDIHLHAGKNIHFSAMGKVDIDAKQGTPSLHLNDPGRKPANVSLPGYERAQPPAGGPVIPPTEKPAARAEKRPEPIGPLLKDIDFAPPPEKKTNGAPEPEVEDEHHAHGTRALALEEMTKAQRLEYAKNNPPMDPKAAEDLILDKYGKYVPEDDPLRGERHKSVKNVTDPAEWDAISKKFGYKNGDDSAAFYSMTTRETFLGPQAYKGASVHEGIHSYEHQTFSRFMTSEGFTAGSSCDSLAEGVTERLTQATGVHGPNAPEAYSPIVKELERVNISTDAMARAQFAGETGPLAAEIKEKTGGTVGQFCKSLDDKSLEWAKSVLGNREGEVKGFAPPTEN